MSKLLLYCTKSKKQKDLLWSNNLKHFFLDGAYNRLIDNLPEYLLNGKIVAECDFDVEEIIANDVKIYDEYGIKYTTKNGCQYIDDNFESLLNNSCLNAFELNDYLGGNNGYAIHIKNLHIFDEPKELYDCLIHPKIESKYYGCEHLRKAPQNMMYVELDDIKYILISIRPQWMCLILNRIKDVEVRRKVLKEMLGK